VKGGDDMRFGIVGGDMRFVHLADMMKEERRPAAGFLQEGAGGGRYPLERLAGCDCIVSNWPMRWPLSDRELSTAEIMENIAPGTVMLLCGPDFPRDRRWDLQYVNLWSDEVLLQENAYLTAEGAVAAVLRRTDCRLKDADCLVVGYGRIGRALTDILCRLEARVTVASRGTAKHSRVTACGARPVTLRQLDSCIGDMHLIFSTPPSLVLDRRLLEKTSMDALIVDLASPPYGVDLSAAHALGRHAWREPGLPGRYCPQSAARVLYNAICRWEENADE